MNSKSGATPIIFQAIILSRESSCVSREHLPRHPTEGREVIWRSYNVELVVEVQQCRECKSDRELKLRELEDDAPIARNNPARSFASRRRAARLTFSALFTKKFPRTFSPLMPHQAIRLGEQWPRLSDPEAKASWAAPPSAPSQKLNTVQHLLPPRPPSPRLPFRHGCQFS
jgi:hypothetical protein